MLNTINNSIYICKISKSNKTMKMCSVWRRKWRNAWLDTLNNLWKQPLTISLTIIIVAIALTLSSLCYVLWKNASLIAEKSYLAPQFTVYLDKQLDNNTILKVVDTLRQEEGVAKVDYFSREKVISEFRNWSGIGSILDMLEENPLPAIAIIMLNVNFQKTITLNTLRDNISTIQGVDEVHIDDSWFLRSTAIIRLICNITVTIGIFMVITIFLVIGNSIRLIIFSHSNTINIMKLLGATNSFIIQPFLNSGVLLGFASALLSFILSVIFISKLELILLNIGKIFNTALMLKGLSWDENLLLLLIATMIGWLSAWIFTIQYLRQIYN